MERFTISLDARLAEDFDRLVTALGYDNRSEAVRDILRERIEAHRLREDEAPLCVANLSYVYNHHERALAERVVELQHRHHDLTIASMHAHLDHAHCIESLLLRGPTAAVRACAQALIAERGVRHGAVNVVPVDGELQGHDHRHAHLTPKS